MNKVMARKVVGTPPSPLHALIEYAFEHDLRVFFDVDQIDHIEKGDLVTMEMPHMDITSGYGGPRDIRVDIVDGDLNKAAIEAMAYLRSHSHEED